MTPDQTLISVLRNQTGLTVTHQRADWTVIDVVTDEPAIVLERQHNHSIQANQHGDGHRRTPTTASVPILDQQGSYHPQLIALGLSLSLPRP